MKGSLVFVAGLASGQGSSPTSSSSSSPTSTSSSAVPTQTVNVGAEGLVFTPNSITANVGDVIEFRFYPQNHSVARSDYKSPCIPYEDTGVGRQGFWSGFRPINVVLSQPPTFQVTVDDTAPIFFYCSAPGACIDDGMIGVVNPNSTETLAVQQAYAKNATLMFSPGEFFPSEVAPTSTSASSSTSSSSTSTSTNTATSTPVPAAATSSSSPALSTGAIAGIAIGGVAVLLLAAFLIYLCGRQRTIGEIINQHQNIPPPSYHPAGHMSMASSSYPPKPYDGLGLGLGPHHQRYSSPPGTYDRSAADTEIESYRSRSPPWDETREAMIPSMGGFGSPGAGGGYSPGRGGNGSPVVRRPVPQRGGTGTMPNSIPATPMYQDEADVPSALRVSRVQSPHVGPHELSVESDRNYLPYQHPDFPKNEHIGLGRG